MSKYQSICQRFFILLISIAIYSCQGAGGAGFAETEAIVSAMTAKEQKCHCSECGKFFSQKNGLSKHMRTHTGERPYVCSRCDKAFSQKITLTDHMLTHTGRKPYRCSECGMKFSKKGNLNVHIRTHTGERTYACSECDKAFLAKGDLTTHMRTHTGERPYHCSKCSKTFSRKDGLDRHMTLVHKHRQVKKEEFEHPDVLEEKLKSMTANTATVLDFDPGVLEKIWDTAAAAEDSAASEDLE